MISEFLIWLMTRKSGLARPIQSAIVRDLKQYLVNSSARDGVENSSEQLSVQCSRVWRGASGCVLYLGLQGSHDEMHEM